MQTFNTNAHKKPTNLSINSDLLVKAKAFKINLSATLEKALIKQLRVKQQELWLKENAKAIDAYNNFVEKEGVFSDDTRSF